MASPEHSSLFKKFLLRITNGLFDLDQFLGCRVSPPRSGLTRGLNDADYSVLELFRFYPDFLICQALTPGILPVPKVLDRLPIIRCRIGVKPVDQRAFGDSYSRDDE